MALDQTLVNFFKQLPVYELLTFVDAFKAAQEGKSLSQSADGASRETSAYERAVNALNKRAMETFHEQLLVKRRKGQSWRPTPTGYRFFTFCSELEKCVLTNFVDVQRFAGVRPVRIGMQQLSLMDLRRIENRINNKLKELNSNRKFEKRIEHVGSEQFPTILSDSHDMDFAFGGLINEQTLAPELEFIEVERRPYFLISNFDLARHYTLKKDEPITVEFLQRQRVPLVIAHVGVIVDFLAGTLNEIRRPDIDRSRYLEQIRTSYLIVEECNDVHFVIELLCTTPQKLCMFGTADIFQRATERATAAEIKRFCTEFNFAPPKISYHPLAPDLPALRVGVVRRKPQDKVFYPPDHPIQLFWDVAKELREALRSNSK